VDRVQELNEPVMADERTARRATGILIAVRAGYAYNWYNVGPALVPIGATFSVGPADWGLLIGVFLVGAGLFQVPAGLLARRYGSRAVALSGAGLLALAASVSAFAPDFALLLAGRFLAGVGAALFFSPAIGLVASLFPAGKRGVPIGAFSSAFSAGAAVGVLLPALVIPVIGWRESLLFGGVALGLLTLAAFALVPASTGTPTAPASIAPGVPRALRFRGVWAIGLAFVGLEGASFATGQFIVPFGETIRGWSAALAGSVGLMFILPSVAGGPLGGRYAERHPNHRTQFVVWTVAGAAVLLALPIAGPVVAILIGSLFSFAYGVIYAVMYVIPHFWPQVPAEEVPLAIGLFNSIQLAGGALVSFLFGWLVSLWSYGPSWVALSVLDVAFLAFLFALPPTLRGALARRPRAAASAPP